MKETRERAECTVETESTRRERRSVRGFDCGGNVSVSQWGGGRDDTRLQDSSGRADIG